jgi:hypothetical protein
MATNNHFFHNLHNAQQVRFLKEFFAKKQNCMIDICTNELLNNLLTYLMFQRCKSSNLNVRNVLAYQLFFRKYFFYKSINGSHTIIEIKIRLIKSMWHFFLKQVIFEPFSRKIKLFTEKLLIFFF